LLTWKADWGRALDGKKELLTRFVEKKDIPNSDPCHARGKAGVRFCGKERKNLEGEP